jgi:hypothetical protein
MGKKFGFVKRHTFAKNSDYTALPLIKVFKHYKTCQYELFAAGSLPKNMHDLFFNLKWLRLKYNEIPFHFSDVNLGLSLKQKDYCE